MEELFDTGDHATLYNLRIADWHTYFVGQESWGWAAWAHNRECRVDTETRDGKEVHVLRDPDGNEITSGPDKDALIAKGKALDAERAAGIAPRSGKSLLAGEGAVGTYDDLKAAGSPFDNITRHHIPSANHMKQHGVAKGDGISINMEHPHPGSGGRLQTERMPMLVLVHGMLLVGVSEMPAEFTKRMGFTIPSFASACRS